MQLLFWICITRPKFDARFCPTKSESTTGKTKPKKPICQTTEINRVIAKRRELNGKTLVSDSKPYNVTDDGQLLLIFKSDYKHEGTYRCVASNGQYRDQLVLARPNLKLSEGANVRLNFVSAYVARGQNASILCSSSSTSRVSNLSLSWWHDDAKVQSDQMRFTEEGVWLQIQNLTEQQAGRYVCNGTNAVGSDRAELLLRVHHPYNYVWPLTGILLQLFILGSCIACCPEKKKRRPHAE